ncbi:MAG: F0F1 ATP synthase subunit gamma [Gammaproteobacteria bacterium]
MKREQKLRRRLRSLDALGEAIGAMKDVSAQHYREMRGAVEPARAYREGVERILGWTGAELGAGTGPAGLLVIGAELGLCGGYNVQVAAAAAERRAELGPGPTVCSGRRTAALLTRRGVELTETYSAPTSARGIAEFLLRLAENLLTAYVEQDLSSLDIVSTRFAGVGAHPPSIHRLLPLVAERSDHGPAVRYVSRAALAFAVIREYLYVSLYDLLIDALAAEHGARLVATEAAGEWLDERSERVRQQLAAARREAGTQEVIEIAAGARARRLRTGD